MYGLYYLILYYFSFFYTLNIFSIGNFVLISGFKEFLIVILFALCVYKNSKINKYSVPSIRVKKSSYPLIIYACCILLASIRSHTLAYIFIDIKYYLIWGMFIYITSSLITNVKRLRNLVCHVNIICVTIGILGYLLYLDGNVFFLQWRSAFQVYSIKSIVSTNIDFGSLMVIGVLFNIVLIRKTKAKLFNFILIILYSYLAYFSYSRSIYISLLLILYLFSISYIVRKLPKNGLDKFFEIVFNIAVVIVCIILINFYGDDSDLLSSASFMDRLMNTWPSLKVDSILLGDGFGAVGRSVNSVAIYTVSDNNYLRVLLNMGIVGLLVIFFLFRMLYQQACDKHILRNIYLSIGTAAFFTDYFTLTPAMLLLYTMIGICMTKFDSKTRTNSLVN